MALNESTKPKSGTKKKNEKRKGNSTTNNLFMCFRPVWLEPDCGSSPGRSEPPPPVTYIAVPETERPVVFPGNDNAGLSFDEEEEEEEEESGFTVVNKVNGSSSSRRFTRSWKAPLFEPSMARKTKKRKPDKKSQKQLSVESARYNYQETSEKDDSDFLGQRGISRSLSDLATSSSASSYSICPNCSCSLGSNPNDGSDSDKTARGQRGCYGSNSGLLLMLISLLVLVFWGRVCAIFCTSTWFFLVPRWIVKDDRINSPSATMTSPESKRKIVMEGLLARQRRSFRCQ